MPAIPSLSRLARFLAALLLTLSGVDAFAVVTPLPGTTPQTVRRGDHFAPLRVRVTDATGAPVAGATVRWNLPTYLPESVLRHDSYGNCSFDLGQNCSVTTGNDGVAELNATFALNGGTQALRVLANSAQGASLGEASLELAATATIAPAALRIFGGDGQTGVHGSTLAQPFVVQMFNADGTPRANAAVRFAVASVSPNGSSGDFPGSAPSVTVNTDAQGIAISPPMTIRLGLGAGLVKASVFDANASTTIETPFTFTSTTPGGATALALQDTWWAGPQESGWGLSIAQQGDLLFTVLFVYDHLGQPTWYTLDQATWAGNARFERMTTRFYSPTGSPWFAYDASRFVPGAPGPSGLFRFFSDTELTLHLASESYVTAPTPMRRFDFSGSGAAPPIAGLTGLWWGGTSQAGWALSISEREGDLFGLWFTYDEIGARTWFSLTSGAWQPGTRTYAGTIFRTEGPRWPEYDPSLVATTSVGTFSLTFHDQDRATFDSTIGARSLRTTVTRYRP